AVGSALDGPVAVGPGGLAITATYGGVLLGVDASGGEKMHAIIDKQAQTVPPDAGAAASFFATSDLKPSPPVVVDDEGRVGFARAGGRVGVVAPDGSVAIV